MKVLFAVVVSLLIPAVSYAYTHLNQPLPAGWTIQGDVLFDSNNNEYWYLPLNQQLAATQADAQSIADSLASSHFAGFSDWHLANKQEISHLLNAGSFGWKHVTDAFIPSYDVGSYGAASWCGWLAEPMTGYTYSKLTIAIGGYGEWYFSDAYLGWWPDVPSGWFVATTP